MSPKLIILLGYNSLLLSCINFWSVVIQFADTHGQTGPKTILCLAACLAGVHGNKLKLTITTSAKRSLHYTSRLHDFRHFSHTRTYAVVYIVFYLLERSTPSIADDDNKPYRIRHATWSLPNSALLLLLLLLLLLPLHWRWQRILQRCWRCSGSLTAAVKCESIVITAATADPRSLTPLRLRYCATAL